MQQICGLPLSTYPSAVKLTWLLRNDEKVKEAYAKGELSFGTPDTWLLWNLTGGASKDSPGVFVTDTTNASRTMFMDLATRKYSDEMLSFFGVDRSNLKLAEIVPSAHPTAFGKFASGPLKGKTITGVLGDQSAALVGQLGFTPGSAKNTYGTGCFLLYNVGTKPVFSTHGLLATVAYDFSGVPGAEESSSSTTSHSTTKTTPKEPAPTPLQTPVYALEGSIATAGSAVKFLTDNLGIAPTSSEITELASSVPNSGGLIFVTAFSGLFAPYWIDDAKGTIFGITAHTSKAHVARATLEATCFQTKAILDAMEKDSGKQLTELRVDGGMSNSDVCMQAQADIIQIKVDRPAMRETTSLGSAIAAGLAVGVWKSLEDVKGINAEGRTAFEAKMSPKESAALFKLWEKGVRMATGWQEEEEEIAEGK